MPPRRRIAIVFFPFGDGNGSIAFPSAFLLGCLRITRLKSVRAFFSHFHLRIRSYARARVFLLRSRLFEVGPAFDTPTSLVLEVLCRGLSRHFVPLSI